MSWQLSLLVIGGLLTITIMLGIPVAAAMGLVGIVSITLMRGTQLWPSLGDIIWNTASSFTLVAIPLFVLMGEVILRSGAARRFYMGLNAGLGKATALRQAMLEVKQAFPHPFYWAPFVLMGKS